jgi:hypothetical protein
MRTHAPLIALFVTCLLAATLEVDPWRAGAAGALLALLAVPMWRLVRGRTARTDASEDGEESVDE